MKPIHIALCCTFGSALLFAAPLLAVRNQAPPDPHQAARQGKNLQNQNSEGEGQRVFNQNCARCHNAPDGFPASVTGTIVRHMRVRANLSRHDEEVLLHYFNP
jgi:cytochrome c5